VAKVSVRVQRGLLPRTFDSALRAVGLLHRLPLAPFNPGLTLARSGEEARAIVAFETALRFQPNLVNAHRYLAPGIFGSGSSHAHPRAGSGDRTPLRVCWRGPVAGQGKNGCRD